MLQQRQLEQRRRVRGVSSYVAAREPRPAADGPQQTAAADRCSATARRRRQKRRTSRSSLSSWGPQIIMMPRRSACFAPSVGVLLRSRRRATVHRVLGISAAAAAAGDDKASNRATTPNHFTWIRPSRREAAIHT